MSKQTAPTFTAFRYMKRFRCIGGDCEASCCSSGWNIAIDREHYDKTRSAMSKTPATRQEFDAKFKRVKTVARTHASFALAVLQDNGDCSFFGPDRMCSLQQRYGEGVLSDTCAVYPRSILKSGTRLELAGLTSCPEVSRQLLLHEDALELDEVDATFFARPRERMKLPDHPAAPYLRYHDELRNLMIDVLSDKTYPLTSRLSFIAYFANRTVPFMHQDVATLDEERLLAEVQLIQDPAVREELHREFADLPIEPGFSSRVVLALLGTRSKVSAFGQLLDAVTEEYGGSIAIDGKAASRTPEQLREIVRAYEQHKAAWAAYQPRIDGYLANYAKNFWSVEWYVGSPNLLAHAVLLFTRIAALRFLLLGHPLLAAAIDKPEADKKLALDRAVVDTVQKFSRIFEHDLNFTKVLKDKLADAQLITLAHAACLAAF
jgi:lysine-N-methylase